MLALLSLALIQAPVARAAFPGVNGRIAFVGSGLDIFSINPDGTGSAQLTTDPGADRSPHWSPDGMKIAYRGEQAGNADVFVMNPDGSGQIDITNTFLSIEDPTSWSPDGARILFTTDRDAGNSEVYVMGSDGTLPVNLTNNVAVDDAAAWSPSGKKIAFTSNRSGFNHIWLMDPDGAIPCDLTQSLGDHAAWLADGSRVLFDTPTGDMFSAKPDCAFPDVQPFISNATSPAPSPDGSCVAFVRGSIWKKCGATEQDVSVVFGSQPDWRPVDVIAPATTVDNSLIVIRLLGQEVTGLAIDNAGPPTTTVIFSDLLLGGASFQQATCVTSCLASTNSWSVVPDVIPGLYSVAAYSVDRAGNKGPLSGPVVMLIV